MSDNDKPFACKVPGCGQVRTELQSLLYQNIAACFVKMRSFCKLKLTSV